MNYDLNKYVSILRLPHFYNVTVIADSDSKKDAHFIRAAGLCEYNKAKIVIRTGNVM